MRQGWEIIELGEVCETGAGGTPLKAHKDYYEGGTIPWLLSGEVSQGEVFEARNFITEKGLKNSSAKLFPPNTVLVAMYGATAGQVGLLRFEACTNQAVCGILPNDKTIPEYLFYCFLSKKDELVSQAVGGAQPNISQIKIRNTKILLPPLPEQQRIVGILDGAFASIAKAKANAEQNLKNAKELFESYKNELFLNKGKGFEERELMEICDKITQGPNPKYDKDGDDKFRVLKTKNLYDNNIFYDESDRVSESVFKSCLPSELKNGDVLLAIVGQGSINKCNVFENKTPFRFIYTRALGLIRVKTSVLNPYYLKEYLQSNRGKKLINSGIGGTSGQQVVTTTFIKALKIPLPSLKDQLIIIQKLDALSSETKKLEANYQQKLNDLEELKKSILQKVFNGELKTTNQLQYELERS